MKLYSYVLFIYIQLTDVILFLALQTLECPIIRGKGPEACEGHSKTVIDQQLFIFGGCEQSADINNDLYIIHTEYRENYVAVLFGYGCLIDLTDALNLLAILMAR
ncbi:unnamed protein product [Trifolium pratense]|uniref:Uncharacterized protein n=1 Tax=Trifolium pratense TaxID=57577 RepID=A0ACB0KAS4_TRIPR|nr:unnamed protein product [Trifolium pratense]